MGKFTGPIIALALVALAGFFLFTDDSTSKLEGNFENLDNLTAFAESENKTGANEKGVEIIEYGDFQCPFCARFHPTIKQIKEDNGDDISIAYRHFPLIAAHPNAMAAHRAAEAAGIQGKFFEMHDWLFENQVVWSQAPGVSAALEEIEAQAVVLELDVEKWRTDAQSQAVFDKITAQQESGNQLGVTGTPTLFVNGERINTPGTVEEFQQIIDAAIAGDNLDDIETTGESSDDAVPETEESTETDAEAPAEQ